MSDKSSLHLLRQLLRQLRTAAEYANGYNSPEWVAARREGVELCITCLERQALPPLEQWAKDYE